MADTVLTDVVSETAQKVTLDKKFFLGLAAGATVVGLVWVGTKVKDRFATDSSDVVDTDAN